MNIKRLIVWVLVALSLGYIMVLNLPWKYEIDTTMKGIQYRNGDVEYSEDVTIKVKGVYRRYLTKDDTFKGEISVDIYDFTGGGTYVDETFVDGKAELIYSNMSFLGLFLCEPDFTKLMIGISEPIGENSSHWSTGDGLIISAPAHNRDEAVEITKILSKRSKWLSHKEWWK